MRTPITPTTSPAHRDFQNPLSHPVGGKRDCRVRGPLLDPDQAQAVNQSFDPVINTSTIDRMHLLNRYQVTLAHNTTDEHRMTFTVSEPGYNQVQFLLFNETVPDGAVTGQERID